MNDHSRLPTLALLFGATAWGASWIPLKFLNDRGLEGILIIFLAYASLAVLMISQVLRTGDLRYNPRTMAAIALTGGPAVLCLTYALVYGNVVRVMVLFYLLPAWGVLGGRVFLGERISAARWFSVIAALIGAFLALGHIQIFDEPPNWIDAMALASGTLFAANNIVFRKSAAVALSSKMFAMFSGGAAISGALLVAGVQPIPTNVTFSSWMWLAGYAFFWLLVTNVTTQWAVERLEAGRSSIILSVELVVAVISAVVLRGETLAPIEWLGCALVVAASAAEAIKTPLEAGQN